MLFFATLIFGLVTSGGHAAESQEALPECRFFVSHGSRCLFDQSKTKCSRRLTLKPRANLIHCVQKVSVHDCDRRECVESQKIPYSVEPLPPNFDCDYLVTGGGSCVLVDGQCGRVKEYKPRVNDRQCFRFRVTRPCRAEECGGQRRRILTVNGDGESPEVDASTGEVVADSHCTYLAVLSQECFTLHGKCKKVNRLVDHADRQRCPDFEYLELCVPASCYNDAGQQMPEVGQGVPACQYSKPAIVQKCQKTSLGCRKQLQRSSKKAGMEPECYNFTYWTSCDRHICYATSQPNDRAESIAISSISEPRPEVTITDPAVSSPEVKIGLDGLVANSRCTYTLNASSCFTVHEACKSVNRLIDQDDRRRCPDFEYLELCRPQLCSKDFGDNIPKISPGTPDCEYVKRVTIQNCRKTDYGCRKQIRIRSENEAQKPKCHKFTYWASCSRHFCSKSSLPKRDPKILNLNRECEYKLFFGKCRLREATKKCVRTNVYNSTMAGDQCTDYVFEEECSLGACATTKTEASEYDEALYNAEVPQAFRAFVDGQETTASTSSFEYQTDHTATSETRGVGKWDANKEHWSEYDKALYDAEVPPEFRAFVDEGDAETTESPRACTYRTTRGPCHFQKVSLEDEEESVNCVYFEDKIETNRATHCRPVIRSSKPCSISQCRKTCDEILPPWSKWGHCSATCYSGGADGVGRPFRMRRRSAGRKAQTGCALSERSDCVDLPLCPSAADFKEDDDYGQDLPVRKLGSTVVGPASSTAFGTISLVLICIFAILTVLGALGIVFAIYRYYF